MNRLLHGLWMLLLALPVAAQVSTGKPGSPSLDTGETHFPDHLWLMNEGAGTTLEDDGDHTDHDMTFGANAPSWAIDGTHGDYLDFVAANTDIVTGTVSGFSGTQVTCFVSRFAAGTGARAFGSFTDPSQSDRKALFLYQGDEDIEIEGQWDNTATTNTSVQDGTGGWDLVCFRWSDSTIDWSLNGGNWDVQAATNTGLVAGVTAIAFGADNDAGPGAFFDGDITAVWHYHGDKDNTAIAAIYNSGNPWPIIGVDASAPPSFAVAPSCSAATDGVSCTYTASATSTAYGVGVALGDGAPTCTQIKAGQNDGGTAALATGSDANTGTSDTIAVTGTNPIAKMDYHFCLNNAGGDSAVDSSQVDELRSARAGFAFVTMASHSSTGVCNLDSYFNPDCADGDVFEYEDDTNEDADCNISFEADGDFVATPVGAGDCDGKRTFNISYEDASSATTGLFTAPAVGNFATDDLICFNNTAPEAGDPFGAPLMWQEDAAIEALDLSGYITDADGDTLTFTLTTGTWPTGVSQSGTGNKDVTGTPTTENESGVALVVTGTDECGDSATFSFYDDASADVYVVNTWTVPDVVTLTVSAAEDAVIADAPWRIADAGVVVVDETCSVETPGTILTQDPAATAEAGAFDPIEVTIAEDCSAGTWVSYARVWMFKEVRRVYLTTTAFKRAVELELRNDAAWARWKPGTIAWSGSSNMQIDVTSIPGVPSLYENGAVRP